MRLRMPVGGHPSYGGVASGRRLGAGLPALGRSGSRVPRPGGPLSGVAGGLRGAGILPAGADRGRCGVLRRPGGRHGWCGRCLPAGSWRHEGGGAGFVAPASCRQGPIGRSAGTDSLAVRGCPRRGGAERRVSGCSTPGRKMGSSCEMPKCRPWHLVWRTPRPAGVGGLTSAISHVHHGHCGRVSGVHRHASTSRFVPRAFRREWLDRG